VSAEAILDVCDLRAAYGGTPILQGADFSIGRKQIVAVIGRNGVGKTTLMKCLIGLLPSRGGRITYKGDDITRLPAHRRARRGIGYIPQGRGVFPRMTVAENIVVGELIGRDTDRRLYDLVYQTFPVLAAKTAQIAGTLSGGQQQMLAIARAVVGGPDLLLLDEPSEGIQPSIVQEISLAMREISAQLGTTIVFVEQNISMIRAMAQRCYIMDKGRITTETPVDSLADAEVVRRYLAV
jgi:branched-chain amino acid transport system ATP-binding protein